ncbi:MAG: hypothetical protein QJR08_10115 [Bacillota bacterium]|nr:hypothetical protein [Bacillota bacterium]
MPSRFFVVRRRGGCDTDGERDAGARLDALEREMRELAEGVRRMEGELRALRRAVSDLSAAKPTDLDVMA